MSVKLAKVTWKKTIKWVKVPRKKSKKVVKSLEICIFAA